jgi:hypothetical protein
MYRPLNFYILYKEGKGDKRIDHFHMIILMRNGKLGTGKVNDLNQGGELGAIAPGSYERICCGGGFRTFMPRAGVDFARRLGDNQGRNQPPGR